MSSITLRRLLILEGLVVAAGSIAGSFSAIFLLRRGIPLEEVGIFYLIAFASALVGCYAFAMGKMGNYRGSVVAAMAVSGAYYVTLLILPSPWVVVLPAILWGGFHSSVLAALQRPPPVPHKSGERGVDHRSHLPAVPGDLGGRASPGR